MNLRWEWRTFGDSFGAAESRLGSLPVESVVESDETYLLSAESRDAVKVRAGLMDVKHLERVGADGLELWKPVMKAALPISAADALAVLAALGVRAPLADSSYDLDGIAGVSSSVLVGRCTRRAGTSRSVAAWRS